MDIREAYHQIQKKFNLEEGVQELYLYETYLNICRQYFTSNQYQKIAIYGAGRNTTEIMESVIWKEIKNSVKVIIDNNFKEKTIQEIPVIKEQELSQYDIEVVWISSWEYREEMVQSIKKSFQEIEIFEPYKKVTERLPEAKTAFFTYKKYNKYQWFANKRKALTLAVEKKDIQQLLKDFIHGYFAIYDWVNLKETLITYNNYNFDDNKKYLLLEEEINNFLGEFQRKIQKRTQGDCVIFLIDALSKYVAENMSGLSQWKEKGIWFEHYINEYPATREALTSLLTGWHPIDDRTYLNKKIEPNSSSLLKMIQKMEMEIKLISATNSAENYSKINCYDREEKEDILLTEVIFRGMEELLKSEKQQLIIIHSYDTIHPFHWNPVSTNLTWENTLWEDHKERFNQSVAYTDKVIDFTLKLFEDNHQITKIVMGDHGINLESEYASNILQVPTKNNIGLWDLEILSPAFLILNDNYNHQVINKLVSTNYFYKILQIVLKKDDINSSLEDRKFLELQFIPGYDSNWIKRMVESRNRSYVLGLKGIVSLQYLYVNFEDGTDRLFEISGKNLIECIEKKELFIKEIGEENYNSCRFPAQILSENFFDEHNRLLKHEHVIKNIDLEITEKCSLKCQDCMNCMQYYKRPKDIPLKNIKESLDILTENVDEIVEVRILGGEPFMNKDLGSITQYVCEKKNIKNVIIYTNATILPTDEELKVFQHNKVSFYITDYGIRERQKLNEFEEILKKYKVPYHIYKLGYWYKIGKIQNNHKSKVELENMYKFCRGRSCITLLDGKLFQCEFVANANRLKAIPDYKEDYVDLFEKDNLKIHLTDFLYKKNYMESCQWCNLTTDKVKPAIQISHSLDYEERE